MGGASTDLPMLGVGTPMDAQLMLPLIDMAQWSTNLPVRPPSRRRSRFGTPDGAPARPPPIAILRARRDPSPPRPPPPFASPSSLTPSSIVFLRR